MKIRTAQEMRTPALVLLPFLLLGFVFLGLFIGCQTGIPTRNLPEPVVPKNAEAPWRQDLSRFERQLPKRHFDLFHQLPQAEFTAMVEELNRRAPELSAAEFDIELRKILARVGDSHTNLSWEPETLYPYTFLAVKEGVIVAATTESQVESLGMRLVAIDGLAIEEVRERMATIIPHENEAALTNSFVHFVLSPDFLFHLGIAQAPDRAEFTFADYQGGQFSILSSAAPREGDPGFIRLTERLGYTKENAPLYMQNRGEAYWWQPTADRRLLYLAYNSCREVEEYPIDQLLRELEVAIEAETPEAVIVDLRHNGGGDSRVLHPVIRRLGEGVRSGEFDLYAFIGKGTFSSAVLNAIELEDEAGAILVGAPTGGKPNHYGEIKFLELPNLGARVSYSTKYFERYTGARAEADSVYPDIDAPISLSSILQKRDPAMEAVRRSM